MPLKSEYRSLRAHGQCTDCAKKATEGLSLCGFCAWNRKARRANSRPKGQMLFYFSRPEA